VHQAATDRFTETIAALVVTALLTLAWPCLLWALAALFGASGSSDAFVLSAAAALNHVALLLLLILLLWHLCRPGGLGEKHFGWRAEAVELVRRHSRWLILMALPLLLLSHLPDRPEFSAQSDSLGRIAYLAVTLGFMVFLYLLLHPQKGILGSRIAANRSGWLARLRLLWFPAIMALNPAFGVLACAGYFFTARQLSLRFAESLWFVLTAVILAGMVTRWLSATQRRLALERRRAQPEEEGKASPGTKEDPDDHALDAGEVSAQTLRLLRSAVGIFVILGLFAVWVEVLPALARFDEFVLWVPGGADMTVPEGSPVPLGAITVLDLGVALVILFATIALARNIPGVLEILVLRSLPLSSGARYATRTLTQYLIFIVGLALTFGAVGIGWGKVQWLAAAITVGLGFGLQEIFANFVSGLIILTERPIRIGDTVTVDNVNGTVTRIHIRATTITDWDRKELVIPNKQFVTGQITNWTLSNSLLRLRLEAGIAYGSDTDAAKRCLLDVARAEPSVVETPAPSAIFKEFGDSALQFELRVFIEDVENFALIRDRLFMAIDRAFREEGIEIAFPQRDLHLKSGGAVLPVTKADSPEER